MEQTKLLCKCNKQAITRKVVKEGENKGRLFYTCNKNICKFFQWCVEEELELKKEDDIRSLLENISKDVKLIREWQIAFDLERMSIVSANNNVKEEISEKPTIISISIEK